MNPIYAALQSGHDPEKILRFLSGLIPNVEKNVRKAKKLGYDTSQILNFLGNAGEQELQSKGLTQAQIEAEKKRGKREKAKKGVGQLVGLAATLGTAYYGGRLAAGLIPEGFNSVKKLLGGEVSEVPPGAPSGGMPPTAPGAEQVPEEPVNLFSQALGGANIEEMPQGRQEQLKFLDMVLNQQLEEGKSPDDPEVKKLLERIQRIGKGKLTTEEQEYERFLEQYGKKDEETQEPVKEELPEGIQKPQAQKAKVITPEGIGSLVSETAKKALVDSNGKVRQVSKDKIVPMPDSIGEEELATLYDNLIEGIQQYTGQDVSRNVNIAGYDEEANELFYNPHGGASYVYDDIPSAIVNELKQLMRKTTGSNFIGAWEQGSESPIGAGMSSLIQKLIKARRSEGKMEYTKKFNTIYDAFTPAREAKKNVMKRKREEEKARKKKRT